MPLPTTEVDATTPKYLRDKYAIVGVGETTYTRGSGKFRQGHEFRDRGSRCHERKSR